MQKSKSVLIRPKENREFVSCFNLDRIYRLCAGLTDSNSLTRKRCIKTYFTNKYLKSVDEYWSLVSESCSPAIIISHENESRPRMQNTCGVRRDISASARNCGPALKYWKGNPLLPRTSLKYFQILVDSGWQRHFRLGTLGNDSNLKCKKFWFCSVTSLKMLIFLQEMIAKMNILLKSRSCLNFCVYSKRAIEQNQNGKHQGNTLLSCPILVSYRLFLFFIYISSSFLVTALRGNTHILLSSVCSFQLNPGAGVIGYIALVLRHLPQE